MSQYGPYATSVGLIERAKNLMDLMVYNRPQVSGFRLWGHKNLDDAYGNPSDGKVGGTGAVFIAEAPAGSLFRSPSIVRRRQGRVDESMRGQTRFILDLEDFVGDVATGLPSDVEALYVRVQERPVTTGAFNVVGAGLVNAAAPILGPIYVVPSAGFFGTRTPALGLQGKAPANTGCTAGLVPVLNADGQAANPMHVILPRQTSYLRIVAGAQAMLVSFGLGDPMQKLAANATLELIQDGGAREILLASLDNAGAGAVVAPFSLQAVIALSR